MCNICMELLRATAFVGAERQNVKGEDSNRTAVSNWTVAHRFQVVVVCKTRVALDGGRLGVKVDTITYHTTGRALVDSQSLD